MRSFARPVREAGRKIVHIRFVPDTDDAGKAGFEDAKRSQEDMAAEEIPVRLNHRFRHFTVAVHEEIRRQEKGTLFVFDCLSALQTAWATDLMMVNFFAVTTPLLKERGDTALFPLMSQMHSDEAAAKITQIADCFLEVFSDFKSIYLRGLKILNRDRQDLEKPCLLDPDSGSLTLITDGVKLSRFHRARDMSGRIHADLSMDSWDRSFLNAQRKYEYGEDLSAECTRMCRIMMSRDSRMRSLIQENFRPGDYFFVKEHMVGSGQIGGKSCGMLTARKIIENGRPELYDFMEAHDSFYIGRGLDFAICQEGSLKMKEISYVHSEAYAGGELKHGTISLVEDGILVVGVLTQNELFEKTISNMVECKSRGAYLMGLTTYGHYEIEETADFVIYVPKVDPHFVASLAIIPLQLLGYYVAVSKGLDVDKPRNLAKSVTVE